MFKKQSKEKKFIQTMKDHFHKYPASIFGYLKQPLDNPLLRDHIDKKPLTEIKLCLPVTLDMGTHYSINIYHGPGITANKIANTIFDFYNAPITTSYIEQIDGHKSYDYYMTSQSPLSPTIKRGHLLLTSILIKDFIFHTPDMLELVIGF